nr:ribonuclease H-like domain-containing protein [Tanacetum cinerariifolium]
MSLDDVYTHLKVYEPKIQKKLETNSQNMTFISSSNTSSGKGEAHTASVPTASTQVSSASTDVAAASISHDTACAYVASQSNGSQIKYEDITQIDEDDIKEMDIKWNMPLLSRRADRAPISHHRGKRERYRQGPKEEEQAPKALMYIDGIGWDWSYMANEEENHALVADEEIPTEFALMAKSSSSSENEVEARLVEFKTQEIKFCEKIRGLERDVEVRNNKVENLMNELEQVKKEKEGLDNKLTGFESALNDLDTLLGSQRTDKNKEGLGYNVVPPLLAQVYSPPKKDMSWTGLPEFADDTVTNYSRPTPSIDSSKSNTSDLQNSNSSVSEHGESSDCIMSKPMIKFVKAVDSPGVIKTNKTKTARKPPVKYAEMYRNTSKSSKVRGKNLPKNNFTHKNVTLRAVLLKTSRTPIAVNRTNMNVAQPKMRSFAKIAHSNVRRPFQRKSAVRTQFRVPRVSTVTTKFPTVDSKFSTAKSTFTADLGNKGKAVKASACWIWRPKKGNSQNNIDDKRYWDCGCSRHMTYLIFLSMSLIMKNMCHLDKEVARLLVKASADESMLWHRRPGHLNFKSMNKLVRNNLVKGVIMGLNLKNKEMNEFCTKKAIKREFSNARTPQQNWVVKRRNRTLIEAARTMLADAKLPVTFWAKAVNTACYVQNRVLVNKSQKKTPYELFNSRTPAIGYLRPFGFHVMILNTLDHLGNFDAKGDKGYFVGYHMSSKAFSVFNKRTKKVEENLHVYFLENKLIKRGAGPNWLFDIDTLTNSMNYVPVVVAGTSSTNIFGTKDVESQGVKKDVSNLRYIALPNCGISNPIATSKIPAAEQMESLTVESEFPNVSSPVPTVFLDTSPRTTSGLRLISKEVIRQEETPSLVNALTLSNQFEDTIGVKADLSNMESSIPTSPTPTFRIHKDHPKSQIIGPVDTSVQTRHKSKEMEEHNPLAQGHTQEKGINYEEVFTPIVRIEAIRLFLECASFMGLTVYQMDVKSEFLYGTIDEEVYVMQPLRLQDPEFPDRVYKVEKAMGTIDHALFIRKHKEDFLLVHVYVDDIIFGSLNPWLCREFEALMHDKFQMSSMGELTFFLSLLDTQMLGQLILSWTRRILREKMELEHMAWQTYYYIMKEGMSILRGRKSVPGMNSSEREMERGYYTVFT